MLRTAWDCHTEIQKCIKFMNIQYIVAINLPLSYINVGLLHRHKYITWKIHLRPPVHSSLVIDFRFYYLEEPLTLNTEYENTNIWNYTVPHSTMSYIHEQKKNISYLNKSWHSWLFFHELIQIKWSWRWGIWWTSLQ